MAAAASHLREALFLQGQSKSSYWPLLEELCLHLPPGINTCVITLHSLSVPAGEEGIPETDKFPSLPARGA